MSSTSRTPSLTPTPSRSLSPEPPAQPDHFYGADPTHLPPSPNSDGRTWLSPDDDPLAHRGIPVFKPTMEEFKDFEVYMTRVECWGARSGIIKIIPPREWTDALPSLNEPLKQVKIKSPIEQHMLGRGGLFRQENVEKRKIMSVREWAELCSKEDFRAPGVEEVGLHARGATVQQKTRRGRKKRDNDLKAESIEHETDSVLIKEEGETDSDERAAALLEPIINTERATPSISPPPRSVATSATPEAEVLNGGPTVAGDTSSSQLKPKRNAQTREAREANLADRAARDLKFIETFDPHRDWLPPNTKAADYTPDFCHSLERQYWRNCGLAKPAWYGADSQGSLFTDETKYWNVAHLESTLSRLLPASSKGLPGVNTPYLYFGMWRATFAWHVEDMDLFSINFIHFGAPKFWYAVPQGRAVALEQTMRGYFPKDTSQCPQFLRHKSFLASPTLLAQSSCRPNHLVQHAGEIVVTFPRGYHAGFNLGFNCAESVNFALDSWLELGKRAKVCQCVSDSVRIDVTQLLLDRALEAANAPNILKPKRTTKDKGGSKDMQRKRKSDDSARPKAKKLKIKPSSSLDASAGPPGQSPAKKIHVTLKLGPKPLEPEDFPCCLCVSMSRVGLLRVHEPPLQRKDAVEGAHYPKEWKAHEFCASVIPETWVDEIDSADGAKEKVVFGVDGIVRDRWNLKCSACTKTRAKTHGAPIQCTKGKCPKAFHVSCAQGGSEQGVVFSVLRDVAKEVVLVETSAAVVEARTGEPTADSTSAPSAPAMEVDNESAMNVLKVINKVEVQVLCPQHNPAIAAAKRANKQDRIRNDLLALPSMARIKIRVSAGVFEVSLIRVIEESKSVEVLWDRGMKREFKWGSVVFGSTDGPIHQKPSELAIEPHVQPASTSTLPVITYPSLSAATSATPVSPTEKVVSTSISQPPPTTLPATIPATSYYTFAPRPTSQHDYWPKQGAYGAFPPQYSAAYAYAGLYHQPPGMAFPSPHYNAYLYAQNGGYRAGQLQWQQPYQGAAFGMHGVVQQPPGQAARSTEESTSSSPQQGNAQAPSDGAQGPSSSGGKESSSIPTSGSNESVANDSDPKSTTPEAAMLKELAQKAMLDLTTLSTLHPTQLAEILRTNPALREVVSAAIEKHKIQGTVSFS